WQQWVKHSRGRNADADAALLASCSSPCGFESLVEIGENCASIVEQCATSFGELNATRLAAKQLDIEFVLNRLNLAPQSWLWNAEPFRGPRDVTFLCNRDKVAKLSQLHSHTSEV